MREKINSPASLPSTPAFPNSSSVSSDDKEEKTIISSSESVIRETPPTSIPPSGKSAQPISVFAKGKEGFLKKVQEEVEKKQDETPKGVLDALKLPGIWAQLQASAQKNEELHLLALLQRGEPTLVGDHELKIPFFNALERETFSEKREWMAEEIRRISGVYPQLTLEEKEDSEAKKENLIYTPKEKLEYLLEQNPLVADLLQQFRLDVDY